MRRRRRRFDPIRSIGLLGGFNSIADGFATLGEGMGDLMGTNAVDDGGGGAWIHKRKPPHPCALPDIADASWGDVWQCECGTQWVVTNDQNGTLKMDRIQAPAMWGYPGHTTGTGGYGYTTYTMPGAYWWSSSTEERRGDPSGE
jgi:hypothetical protein